MARQLKRCRLNLVSDACFSESGVAELNQLLEIWCERDAAFNTQAQPFWRPEDVVPVQRQNRVALEAFVDAVWRVWREHGGKGHGRGWSRDDEKQGAFIRLLLELFDQAHLKPPGTRTLRRALKKAQAEDAELRANPTILTSDKFQFIISRPRARK